MKSTAVVGGSIAVVVALSLSGFSRGALVAQENKPVPKDSVRVFVPGCTKGYIFTAAPRTTEEAGNFEIQPGMHLRMNGPKKMMAEIKAQEGSMIEITGLIKKGQYKEGVNIGGHVTISPGPAPGASVMAGNPTANQVQIDLEGWRQIVGVCRSR